MEEILMKRFALVLAAAVLGTGCGSSAPPPPPPPPTGEATFNWRFRDLDAVIAGNFAAGNNGCTTAGITDVDVEIFVGATRIFFHTYPCADPSGFPSGSVASIAEGSYNYHLTAFRLSDAVFDAVGVVDIISGSPAVEFATLDVLTPIPLTLYYTQNGSFTCNGTPSVYYAVYTASNLLTLVDSNTISCGSPYGFTLPQNLPVGNYWLDFFQLLDGGGISRWERCSTTLRHAGFPLVIDLAAAPGGGC
jgi:hypothetical protein